MAKSAWIHLRVDEERKAAFYERCRDLGVKPCVALREFVDGTEVSPVRVHTGSPAVGIAESESVGSDDDLPVEHTEDEAEQTISPPVRCPYCGKQVRLLDDNTWHCDTFRGCGKRGPCHDD